MRRWATSGIRHALERRSDRRVDAEARGKRWLTGPAHAAREPYDVRCPLADDQHVLRRGADVFRREVGAAEGGNHIAQVEVRRPSAILIEVVPGARRMTALPPPASSPAAAFLSVIAAESRSASATAALQSG